MPNQPPDYVPGHGLLREKKVVVTAAAGTGIGYATAKRCAEEGARVLISDIHERRLAEAAERLEAETGQRPATAICNVTQEEDVEALLNAATSELGEIDILVNNAGMGGNAAVVEMTDEQWNLVMDVTLNGTFRMTRAAMRHMMPRGQGVIVNNASVLG